MSAPSIPPIHLQAAGTARATAGLPAYLTTNVNRGTGGANGTTSGAGTSGFVNAAATDGTLRPITEALLKGVIADCWNEGATPSVVMCGSAQKQKISTFTGNATRFKEAEDSKLNAAIDVYISDFGSISVTPNRFQRERDGLLLDPEYASVAYLRPIQNVELSKTGDASKSMVLVEAGLKITNEAAHAICADLTTS